MKKIHVFFRVVLTNITCFPWSFDKICVFFEIFGQNLRVSRDLFTEFAFFLKPLTTFVLSFAETYWFIFAIFFNAFCTFFLNTSVPWTKFIFFSQSFGGISALFAIFEKNFLFWDILAKFAVFFSIFSRILHFFSIFCQRFLI